MQGNILQCCPALLPWQVMLPSGDINRIIVQGNVAECYPACDML